MATNQWKHIEKTIIPLYDGMSKIPGGAMVIPLILGSIIGTFFLSFLGLVRLLQHSLNHRQHL